MTTKCEYCECKANHWSIHGAALCSRHWRELQKLAATLMHIADTHQPQSVAKAEAKQ